MTCDEYIKEWKMCTDNYHVEYENNLYYDYKWPLSKTHTNTYAESLQLCPLRMHGTNDISPRNNGHI